jgi:hypothetical protein
MYLIILKYTKINILLLFVLFTNTSCSNINDKKLSGTIYHSDIEAFITDAQMLYTNKQIIITYTKYNCFKVKYNLATFNKKEREEQCKILDSFFLKNHIIYPKRICTDSYNIKKVKNSYRIILENKQNPCYGFSSSLIPPIPTQDSQGIILQFQSKFGLIQGEF